MTITTLSSRELNQDIGRAKKAAIQGPVVITDRGKPSHVLLSFEEYQRILGRQADLIDVLGQPPGVEDIDVEFPRSAEQARPATFT